VHFDLSVSCAHRSRKAAYSCAKSAARYVRERNSDSSCVQTCPRNQADIPRRKVGSNVSNEARVRIKLVSSTYF